jgi:hypothetical protein
MLSGTHIFKYLSTACRSVSFMADCETKIGAFGVFSKIRCLGDRRGISVVLSGRFSFSYSGSCEITIGLFAHVDFVCVRGKEFMCLLVVASVESVTSTCFVSTLGGSLSTLGGLLLFSTLGDFSASRKIFASVFNP